MLIGFKPHCYHHQPDNVIRRKPLSSISQLYLYLYYIGRDNFWQLGAKRNSLLGNPKISTVAQNMEMTLSFSKKNTKIQNPTSATMASSSFSVILSPTLANTVPNSCTLSTIIFPTASNYEQWSDILSSFK